jgi:cephalosporin-C deacetylase-like acetyl esterase
MKPLKDYASIFVKNKFFMFVVITIISGFNFAIAQNEDMSVIKHWMKYSDASNSLYHHLSSQILQHLNKRSLEIEKITTKKGWLERQKKVRDTLMKIVGPFPEKTPLNATIVDVVKMEHYRVEKIIFESQPKFYVPACLYLPEELKTKTPAIIYCSGHSSIAFRSLAYQRVCINLVKKGFIVFAFDPVGQGERWEYYDPDIGDSRVGGPTLEHSYPGAQCFLIGSSQARYMIWDGIRAVDYLLTRKEVDPERVGITGRSGGGTQSAYIAAFDERIYAVAPECYITSFKRLVESRGPQDAEQNFYHGIASGVDHADLLEVRAPKPALMITTTRDFFSIQGARETAEEVAAVYKIFEKEINFSKVEDDYHHTSTRKNREAMYAFFQKHLNLPGNSEDEEVEYLSAEELKITETGQVVSSLKGETVFSLNKKEAVLSIAKINNNRLDLKNIVNNILPDAIKLSGYQKPIGANEAVFAGRFNREQYSIEKWFIKGEGEYVIPFILMIPKIKTNQAMIYLHPEGKSTDTGIGGVMEQFVQNGYIVIAPDLLGYGEMGPGDFRGDAYNFKPGKASFNIWFASIQIARSLVGIHASDISRLINYLQSRENFDVETIAALAQKEICPALLHAVAFDNRISKLALINPLVSYKSIVLNQYYKPPYILSTVAGSLTKYDLPDLCAAVAPRKLLMINVTDQNGELATKRMLNEEFSFVENIYSNKGVRQNFEIRNWEGYMSLEAVFSSWLKE